GARLLHGRGGRGGLLPLPRRLEARVGSGSRPEVTRRPVVIAPIQVVERPAVGQKRREALWPLSQNLLPLGLGERDPELAGEIEHHLLFEREQLPEQAGHLTHGSYHAYSRHDRRGELDRGGP